MISILWKVKEVVEKGHHDDQIKYCSSRIFSVQIKYDYKMNGGGGTLFKFPLTPPPSFWTCMLQVFLSDFYNSVLMSVAINFDKIRRKSMEKMLNLP